MKRLTKSAMIAATVGAALASQSAQAGFTVNDLYLGFTTASASSDLIIDLGQASSLIGSGSVVNLSTDLGSLSTFNSTFNSTANGVVMAVVGGNNTFGSFGVFATQVRSGGAGDAAVPGSSISATHSSTQMSGGAAAVAGLAALAGGLPTAGNSLSDPNKTYSSGIEAAGSQNNFIGKTGVNPAGTIDNTGIIYEDLWAATTGSAYAYKGYFTFNYGTDSLTFTPVPVPEPATYGVLAAAGLLILSVRREFGRKAV